MNRQPIGIITGSGPEAGVDLWQKIIRKNQTVLGSRFRGDIDSPEVVIHSNPTLGLSMELEKNEALVWDQLRRSITLLSETTQAYAIACNTLNFFASRIEALDFSSELISFPSVAIDFVKEQSLTGVCLLGATPVIAMSRWSAYADLKDHVQVEVPSDGEALHQLIYDIKRYGSAHPSLRPRLVKILNTIESDTVFLACTELPLISDIQTDKRLIDVTDLVADRLLARSFTDNFLSEKSKN